MLSKKQLEQEKEYKFPYHHLLRRGMPRGIEYFSYLDIVIRLLKQYKNRIILDLGCGDGKGTKELSKSFKKIIGVDYSKQAISFAKAFSLNVNFKVIDFTKTKIPKLKCDVIVCIEVMEHIKPDKLSIFIRNIANVLKKRGIVIISTPTTNLKLAKKHYQHFNEKKLDDLFKEFFHKKTVMYHSNKYAFFLFFLLRGVVTNRWYDINISLMNYILLKFYKLFVEKANRSNGLRIIYVCEKK